MKGPRPGRPLLASRPLVELQGSLGRASYPTAPTARSPRLLSLPRWLVCTMGTTRVPPHRATVRMTQGPGGEALSTGAALLVLLLSAQKLLVQASE